MATVTNTYDESLTDTLRRFAPMLIGAAVVLALLVGGFFGIRQYLTSQGTVAGYEADADLIRSYNFVDGKKDAQVQILYFFDLQCPACRQNETTIESFSTEMKDKVGIVYKHFPLDIHQYAVQSARALQAAGRQGKFLEYKKKVYAQQDQLSLRQLETWARELNLDIDRWNKDRNSPEIEQEVDFDYKDVTQTILPQSTFIDPNSGQSYGTRATGTPTTVIVKDGKPVDWWGSGTTPEEMKNRVQKYLK